MKIFAFRILKLSKSLHTKFNMDGKLKQHVMRHESLKKRRNLATALILFQF